MESGVKAAEHMIFSTPCENQPLLRTHPFAENLCGDPAWDKQAALDLIHHFATAFLLDTLKGDPTAHAALLPGAVDFARIAGCHTSYHSMSCRIARIVGSTSLRV